MARPYSRYIERAGTVPKKYEPEYLMKLGNLTRAEALALILAHDGDRDRINAELIDRKRRRVHDGRNSLAALDLVARYRSDSNNQKSHQIE